MLYIDVPLLDKAIISQLSLVVGLTKSTLLAMQRPESVSTVISIEHSISGNHNGPAYQVRSSSPSTVSKEKGREDAPDCLAVSGKVIEKLQRKFIGDNTFAAEMTSRAKYLELKVKEIA